MRVPRLATVLAALGAVLGGASPAWADVKVPKALAGVELREGATRVEIDKSVKRLGGRSVIAFRTTHKSETHSDETTIEDEGVELTIIDASTKETLFREPLRSSYARYVYGRDEVIGSFEYKASWKDFDGDGERELVLSLVKSTGAGAPVSASMRVWQVRYGAFREVGAVAAACERSTEDATLGGDEATWIERRRVAVDRFVEAIEMGAKRPRLRCNFADALVASNIAVHEGLMPVGDITAAPFAVDCPALDWAVRHGVRVDPKRWFLFSSTDGLVVVVIDGGAIESAALVDLHAKLELDEKPSRQELRWSEMWIIDAHVWFIAELEYALDDYVVRHLVVYEPLKDRVAREAKLAEYQTARLEHRTTTNGLFELVVESTGKDKKIVWSREAASWWQ